MDKREYYTGIDYFRFIAALLIIAIHTSPLGKINDTGNFILTRVVARVAVPFFFMTSGFFMLSRYDYNGARLIKFIKRTAILYGISILLYMPVNIYNGYFKMDYFIPNLIKDILFDGTMYHLWYLPAAIMGGAVALYLVRHFDYKAAFAISGILYFIGLFGDSYYGVSDRLSDIYTYIFQVCDYTRNGIFFAPVFFVLGGFIAENKGKVSLAKSLWGFVISFSLMLFEALTLHSLNVQRHDSMYIFLLPCMYFLFQFLLNFKGKCIAWLKSASLIIYIIHPMMIVMVGIFSGISQRWAILSDDFLINFAVVCVLSVSFSIIAVFFFERIKSKQDKNSVCTDRTYIEINLKHLEHNVCELKNAMGSECELMAVVKDEAYGHGGYEISTHLDKIGIRAYAVATIDEGIKLRKYGVRGEILILGYTMVSRANEIKRYNLTQTLISPDYADALNEQGICVKAHIKIDTGMHRLGFDREAVSEVKKCFSMKNIAVTGIFTHLCCSDSNFEDDIKFTKGQIKGFYDLLDALKEAGISLPKIHIQSSYGLLNYPELACDYVRAGVALYGVKSLPEDAQKQPLDLRPVLSLKSRIILIRQVKKGDSVGYGRSYIAEKDSIIAILPVGYGDGIPRSLSGGMGAVLINGMTAPIVGRICMDQLAVDITHIKDATVGDMATLISNNNDSLCSADVAKKAGSISNELLSRMGQRLPILLCS